MKIKEILSEAPIVDYEPLGNLENILEIMFSDVLNACVGKIFVM